MLRYRSTIPLLCLCASLTACAIGPDYQRPEVDAAVSFKEDGDWKPTQPNSALQSGAWWQVFNDPVLNQLEEQVEVSNQSVKASMAAVDQARALLSESRASFFPNVSVSAGTNRSSQGTTGIRTTDSVTGSLSWSLDIWGQTRRAVESSTASEQVQQATLASVKLTAQANLALAYFQLRGQDQLQALLDDTVKGDEQALQITQNRYRVGVVARGDVVSAQTQLLAAQAQQAGVRIQRQTLEHAIAVLVGQQPASFAIVQTNVRNDVPTVPPIGLPSELLLRRPDIAVAERRVAAANAQIGVAKGAYFPSLSLGASLGYNSISPVSALASASNTVWSVGPSLAQSLFAGGLHRAQVAAAQASWEASVDNYRQTVLQAFQQVEDELVALRVLQQQSVIEGQLVEAARQAETLTLNQYKAGTVPYSSVIAAQNTRVSSEQSALSVFVNSLTSSVTLINALGGGWDASQMK
jgi:NodT family efflux transporter outer membrane factor (OMF) lipoprotein